VKIRLLSLARPYLRELRGIRTELSRVADSLDIILQQSYNYTSSSMASKKPVNTDGTDVFYTDHEADIIEEALKDMGHTVPEESVDDW